MAHAPTEDGIASSQDGSSAKRTPRLTWRRGEAAQLVRENELRDGAGPLVVRDLRKSFDERVVLDSINLDLHRGELVVILGANGSGKSTALRCIVGLHQPDSGSIHLEGQEIVGAQGRDLVRVRRDIAMVFQQINLVRRKTVLDNVCFGALGRLPISRSWTSLTFPRAVREEAMHCLDRVRLADRATERVSQLSGGQQQRVAIARALCQRAKVVLADEPVAALDPLAGEQVLELLANLAHSEDLAILVVLHQPDLAKRHADRLIGMVDGRVVFDAATSHLLDRQIDGLYTLEGKQEIDV